VVPYFLQRKPIARHCSSRGPVQHLGTVSDQLQCCASLLLIDAIQVWIVSRYSFIMASIVE
jgi:hypothetical protein